MAVAFDVGAAATDEHVEIGAEMRLLHVVDVQLVPASLRRLRRFPRRTTLCEFGIAHIEMQAPRGHVHFDHVPVLHQRERPTGRGLTVRVKSANKRTVSSARWLERQLNDPYVQRAKREGYRSRAAFKLIEIDDKYRVLKNGARVVDLGAAPGGWSQVAAKRIGEGGRIVAIDLLDIEPIPGVDFIQLDFLDPAAPDELKARTDTKGESSLRGHLKAEGDEATGSQSYVPPDPKDDKALKSALDLIRGVTTNSAFPPNAKRAANQ